MCLKYKPFLIRGRKSSHIFNLVTDYRPLDFHTKILPGENIAAKLWLPQNPSGAIWGIPTHRGGQTPKAEASHTHLPQNVDISKLSWVYF